MFSTSTTPSRSSTSASLPFLPPVSLFSSSRASTRVSTNPSRATRTPGAARSSGIISRAHRALSSVGTSSTGGIICAISETRGVSHSVGITFVNITTSEAIVSQIVDSQFFVRTVQKINIFEPSRILMVASKASDTAKSNLMPTILEECPDVPIKQLDRKYWSEQAGLDFIEDLAFHEDVNAVQIALEGKFYAITSFAAAIKHLEVEYSIRFAPHSLRIKYQPSEMTMMIDAHTIQSLELMQNLHNPHSKDCLLGLLNNTCTPMGVRMIRSGILQPSTQVDSVIKPRLDAVQELSSNEEMFFAVRKCRLALHVMIYLFWAITDSGTALKEFFDVEKMLSALTVEATDGSLYETEEAINSVLKMKKFLVAIPELFEALVPACSPLLVKARDLCRPQLVDPIIARIRESINEDATFTKTALEWRNQVTYCVKAGVNGLLDVARRSYKEATDDLHQYVEDFNTAMNMVGEIRFDNNRQYWLRYDKAEFTDIEFPKEFVNHVLKKEFIECQTLDMVKLNHRISNAADEAVMMSDKFIQMLLNELRGYIPQLFRISEAIGLVDMIASFSHLVTTHEYSRPEFDTQGHLALHHARHPILDTHGDFVPNHYFGSPTYRFQMLTGCNMSGKSTYIRGVALLQVMAQIGCFVPTKPSTFPVIHKLFCRVSTDDSIEANMSTFSKEMKEIAFILRNIDDKSLAIVDELGRGTSTRDGLAIAIAVAEALVQSRASVFFATHFTTMAHVMDDRPGVVNLHLATEDQRVPDVNQLPKMTMLYRLQSGTVQQENYGLDLAETMGIPASCAEFARRISETLSARKNSANADKQAQKLAARRDLILNLGEILKSAADMEEDGMNESALVAYLCKVQAEFTWRMSQLQDEGEADDDEMASPEDAIMGDSGEQEGTPSLGWSLDSVSDESLQCYEDMPLD